MMKSIFRIGNFAVFAMIMASPLAAQEFVDVNGRQCLSPGSALEVQLKGSHPQCAAFCAVEGRPNAYTCERDDIAALLGGGGAAAFGALGGAQVAAVLGATLAGALVLGGSSSDTQ